MEGTAEVQLGKERAILTANQSVLIPAGINHGFRNPDQTILHVRATPAAPIFEAVNDKNELSRRWVPDSTGL
jgi:mannose-6-phosphate isomerase-like protein (cupin superfamily)